MTPVEAKKIVVVVGSGRSGTSAMTRGLSALGAELGGNLMPGKRDVNDKGFWEDQDVYSLNIEFYQKLGQEWHSLLPIDKVNLEAVSRSMRQRALDLVSAKTANSKIFGLKDPQLTRLIPFWDSIFHEAGLEPFYVIAVRNPLSVARSFEKYTGFDYDKCVRVWYLYTLAAVLETSGKRRIVVDYDSLMENPRSQLARMALALGLDFDPAGAAVCAYCDEYLEDSLRHAKFGEQEVAGSTLAKSKKKLFFLLSQISRGEVDINSFAARRALYLMRLDEGSCGVRLANAIAESRNQWRQVISYRDSIAVAETENARKNAALIELEAQCQQRDAQINNLQELLVDRTERLEAMSLELIDRTTRLEQFVKKYPD